MAVTGIQRRWSRSWLVALVLLLVVSGCSRPMASESSAPAAADMAMEAPAEPMGEAEAMSAAAQVDDGSGSLSANRKVIRNASLDLVVADPGEVAEQITALAEEAGGYISATNLYRTSYSGTPALQGTMTVRVPAESLDAVLDQLVDLAIEVRSRALDTQDVTDQYSDIDSQLRNLEATEVELRAMLEEVRERPNSTTEDIMSVYRTLTEVRAEIETLQGRRNMYDNLIALATIEVELYPDVANLPLVEEGWRASAIARSAQRALVEAMQALGTVLIWGVMFFLPLALMVLVPLFILGWLLRLWLRRSSRNRKQADPTPEAPA